MSSIREQILTTAHAALVSAAPGGALVFRSRETSITREKTPAIVISPSGQATTQQSDTLDKNIFSFKVEVYVRGDPWVASHAEAWIETQFLQAACKSSRSPLMQRRGLKQYLPPLLRIALRRLSCRGVD